jgi:hypothetical protein
MRPSYGRRRLARRFRFTRCHSHCVPENIDDGGAAWKVDTRDVVVVMPPPRHSPPCDASAEPLGKLGNGLWKIRGWLDRLFGGQHESLRRDGTAASSATWSTAGQSSPEPDRLMRLAADMLPVEAGWSSK